jgi:hypothetical protein
LYLSFTLFPGQSWDVTVDNPNCFVVNGQGTVGEDFDAGEYAIWVRCNSNKKRCFEKFHFQTEILQLKKTIVFFSFNKSGMKRSMTSS